MGPDIDATVEDAIGRAAGDPAAGEIPGSEGDPDTRGIPQNGEAAAPTGEDAIAFAEMVNIGVVIGTAKIRRMDVTREVMELTRFTEDEKEQLRPYAPYAAPYLHQISKHSEAFMALVFCGIGALGIYGRMKSLADLQMKQATRDIDEEEIMKPEAWNANPVIKPPKFPEE